MADPKYPLYHGLIRYDDNNIAEAVAGLKNFISIYGDNNSPLSNKIRKGYFGEAIGNGVSATSPFIQCFGYTKVLAFEKALGTNSIRLSASFTTDLVVYLKEVPDPGSLTYVSGVDETGVTINCAFDPVATSVSNAWGWAKATVNYNVDFPTPSELFAM